MHPKTIQKTWSWSWLIWNILLYPDLVRCHTGKSTQWPSCNHLTEVKNSWLAIFSGSLKKEPAHTVHPPLGKRPYSYSYLYVHPTLLPQAHVVSKSFIQSNLNLEPDSRSSSSVSQKPPSTEISGDVKSFLLVELLISGVKTASTLYYLQSLLSSVDFQLWSSSRYEYFLDLSWIL